jgi:hypothetical protein
MQDLHPALAGICGPSEEARLKAARATAALRCATVSEIRYSRSKSKSFTPRIVRVCSTAHRPDRGKLIFQRENPHKQSAVRVTQSDESRIGIYERPARGPDPGP